MPYEAKTLEVRVYLHNHLVSSEAIEGVEAAIIHVNIGRRYLTGGRHYGRWSIDGVDWGCVKQFLPRSQSSKARWAADSRRLIFRLCLRAAIGAGLDPTDVRGWGRFFKGGSMPQIMSEEREAAGL